MKVHFITYGDKKFYLSKVHIINLAKRSAFFDTYKSFGPRNLDNEFVDNNFFYSSELDWRRILVVEV